MRTQMITYDDKNNPSFLYDFFTKLLYRFILISTDDRNNPKKYTCILL